MKAFHFQQYSPEWWAIRRGIPTASEFKRIITPGKGDYASAADKYMGEIIAAALGWTSSFGGNEDTDRGNEHEPMALKWLRMRYDIETEPVGFILSEDGTHGSSPDALVKKTRIPVEVKSPDLHTFIGWRREMMQTKTVPECHKVQVHGHMHVCQSDACYFVAYAHHPAVDNVVVKVERDAFTDKIGPHLERFTKELRELEAEVLGENVTEYRDGLSAARNKLIQQTTPAPAA